LLGDELVNLAELGVGGVMRGGFAACDDYNKCRDERENPYQSAQLYVPWP